MGNKMWSIKKIKKTKDVVYNLSEQRAQRILQIAIACLLAVGLASIVARGFIKPILMTAMVFLFFASILAWRGKTMLAAAVLLLDMTIMLSVMVWMSGGVHDIGMLGYPAVLVLAAMLGNAYLFIGLLAMIVLYSSIVIMLTVQGELVMNIPTVTYAHLIYINSILLVTGFGVYLLVRDLHRLMKNLKEENALVRHREEQIVELANQDQLTGLPNRRYAESSFDALFRTSKRAQETLVIYFFDLDNFKPVNDSLGHVAGDELLKQLALRLQQLVRGNDILSRFGGDEFIWIKSISSNSPEDLDKEIIANAQLLLTTA